MPTETPSQYRARVVSNAAKSNARPPMQSGNVPTPAPAYTNLPKMTTVPFTGVSGIPPRPASSAPMIPAAQPPMGKGSIGPGFRGK
jgi:hypothetical protein